MSTQHETKRSEIYLAAWTAAVNALPPASKKLLDEHTRILDEWKKDGALWPLPTELMQVAKAASDDPLVSIIWQLRYQTNQELLKEDMEREKSNPTQR